jgi:hypothetical protein
LYKANLIAVTPAGSVPDDLRPFIEFKATLKKIALKREQMVAIFLIESTECYIPVFLQAGVSVQAVKDELAEQEAEMDMAAEKVIGDVLSRMSSVKKK